MILEKANCERWSVYRLTIKALQNFRVSSIRCMKEAGVEVMIYEPTIIADEFAGAPVLHDLETFKIMLTVIVAIRMEPTLESIRGICI